MPNYLIRLESDGRPVGVFDEAEEIFADDTDAAQVDLATTEARDEQEPDTDWDEWSTILADREPNRLGGWGVMTHREASLAFVLQAAADDWK